MGVNYYVELLSRIKSVSIIVEEEDEGVNIEVDNILQVDLQLIQLRLKNQDSNIFIPLPCEVPPIPNISSCLKQRNNVISIRLPLVDAKVDRSTNSLMSISTNYTWNSSYLRKSIQNYTFNCSNCGNTIIDSSKISTTLDMPSELWAEMMDFWHCHKPESKTSYIDKFSSLKPVKNGIITGAYYIAFNIEDDIYGVDKHFNDIKCDECDQIIGEYDSKVKLDKVFNWDLELRHHGKVNFFKPYFHTYDILLDNVNGNATRIIELTNESETKSILIWIFNIGLDVILKDFGLKQNSMKLYYTTDKSSIDEERNNRGDIDQITVLDSILDSTIDQLTSINHKLPKSAKDMGKNWKLGILYKN